MPEFLMDWSRYYHELSLAVMQAWENPGDREKLLERAVSIIKDVSNLPLYIYEDKEVKFDYWDG